MNNGNFICHISIPDEVHYYTDADRDLYHVMSSLINFIGREL